MSRDSLEPGRVLAGRYRLDQRLGEGGMGTIWRAEHLVLAAPVAVKVVDRDVVHDEETIDRFLREARAAAALRSPHVVQILDYGLDGDVPFMVMELLEGETLAQRIRRLGRLSSQDTGRILGQMARAVARAHAAGIVHRDLKPENVFLVQNEDEEIAKVLDFGVAKVGTTQLGQEGARTRTGSLLGTPYYMSPEQAQGNKTVDHRSDLWSLAVIAFECLTGTRPFQSDGLGELVLQICAYPLPVPSQVAPVAIGFDAWFKRATERDPDKRFQTAKDMIEALREALGLEARDVSMLPDVSISIADFEDPGEGEAVGSPSDSGATAADAKAREAEGNARTLIARRDEGPALTVRQFGTTQRTPPPSRRSGSGIVLGVAGAALVVGLAVGFAVLRDRLPKPGPDASVSPPSAAQPPSTPEPEPEPEPEPAPVLSPPVLTEDSTLPELVPRDAGSQAAADVQNRQGGSKREKPRANELKFDGSVMYDRPLDAGKQTEPAPLPSAGPYDETDDSIRGP